MIRSLRLPGFDEALANEVGLFEVLDMPIDGDDEVREVVSGKAGGSAADSSMLVDTASGQGLHDTIRDATMPDSAKQEEVTSAPPTPPLTFTSSSVHPIPQPSSPPPAMVSALSDGSSGNTDLDQSVATALPPPVTSLSDLVFLFTCGVGQSKNFDAAEDDEQSTIEVSVEASASSSPGTIVGVVRRAKAGGSPRE